MARYLFAIYLFALLACWGIPCAVAAGPAADESGAKIDALYHKMERIILPELKLREASLREAVDNLKKQSVKFDTESPAGERGVNIVLKLGEDKAAEARITTSLTQISLVEALKYVTGLANVKYAVEPYAISIVPITANTGVLITKEWKIPKDLISGIVGASKGKMADREMAKKWLIDNGVVFNNQAAAVYIVKSSRLIVRNSQDQLDLIETILAPEIYTSVLIEIECHLVEIEEDSLKDMKFDALLAQFNGPAPKNALISGGDIGHSFTTDPTSPYIAKAFEELIFPSRAKGSTGVGSPLTAVLTDPQFQTILRMLNQKKGVAIFSGPKVTVKNKARAAIEVFREFQDFDDEVPPQVQPVAGSFDDGRVSEETKPGELKDRHVGVTLDVKPTVGPDGFTIDLEISPRAIEFEGEMRSGARDFENHLLFGTPKAMSAVSIYDGSTVIFGNLLREGAPAMVRNKEILLGKAPVVGRFAEQDLEKPERRILMLLVSARLIHADSGPVWSADEKEEVIEPIRPPVIAPEKSR